MIARLRFRPEAAADIADAYAWYEAQRPGLGGEFKDALDAAFTLLRERPEAFPIVQRGLRRLLLPRFPYAIYYRILGEELEVRGCLHTRRHPRRWHRRA